MSEQQDLVQTQAEYWITKLGLIPHLEGGYFSELYRSDTTQQDKNNNNQDRSCFSIIYFLLSDKSPVSLLHEIDTQELFIYQHGDPMEIVKFMEDGSVQTEILGPELDKGQKLTCIIKPCKYFGSRTLGKYTLFSCACYPGFLYEGFRIITKKELYPLYPQEKELIEVYGKDS